MADSQNKRVDGQYNIFIANDIYPEADKIFSTKIKSLEEIKDSAFIVLDTNVLLVPYNISKESLGKIEDTYRLLTEQDRLIVPAQVAREFANNRAKKIVETFQQLTRKRNTTRSLQSGKYPLLESLDEYQDAIRLEKEIDDQLKEYRKVVGTVLDHIRDWRWNDPVSLIYENFFNEDSVYEPLINKEELVEDLDRRQTYKIPPGYKDASKDDRGIGDLLIWHTILEIGREFKVDIIFVSGDDKSDWWHKSEERTLYPRYELVDEFRRFSGGKSFHITSFSHFLDLFGASKSIVQEIRDEENQLRSEESSLELVFDKDVYYLEKGNY